MNSARVIAGTKLSSLRFIEEPASSEEHRIRRILERDRAQRCSGRGLGIQRKRNEFVQGMNAYRDGWFYDTASFAAGAAFATTQFFQIAQNGAKLLNSTNMTGQAGQLPAGTTMMVAAIRVSISNLTTPADFANIFANCSIEFIANNLPIYQATPDYFPAGFGAPTFSAANVGTVPTGSSVLTSTNNGMPVQTAIYEFKNPYSLASLESFVVKVTPQVAFNMVAGSGVNPPGLGTTIRIYLDGMKRSLVVG